MSDEATISFKIRLREYVRATPAIFGPVWSRREDPRYHRRVVRAGDDMVIEGFPRSANSFASHAFRLAQPEGARLASHFHSAAQIGLAHRHGVPAIVVVRAPRDALTSWLVYDADGGPVSALYRYIRFHETLLERDWRYVLSPFEETTTRFGDAVARANRIWNVDLGVPAQDAQAQEAVFASIRRAREGRLTAKVVSAEDHLRRDTAPSAAKADLQVAARARLDQPRLATLLGRAQAAYDGMIARGDVG